MPSCADAVVNYIRAKDFNHPRLMRRAFASGATLTMTLRTDAIAFPPLTEGVEAITDVLVRRFAQKYENVFTFCLADPPGAAQTRFQCDWLVGMSEKDGGAVRVGCGRYDWSFTAHSDCLCERLGISIELMESLSPERIDVVMGWLSSLPYPWCASGPAHERMPAIVELSSVRDYLRRVHA